MPVRDTVAGTLTRAQAQICRCNLGKSRPVGTGGVCGADGGGLCIEGWEVRIAGLEITGTPLGKGTCEANVGMKEPILELQLAS